MSLNKKVLIIAASIIVLLLLIAGGIYVYNRNAQDSIDDETQTTAGATSAPTATPSATATVSATPTPKPTGSTITSVDAQWNKYTNNSLGFSIKIPKTMSISGASCKKEANSYRTDSGLIPVKILEDSSTAYITHEYYYLLGGESKDGDTTNYATCAKTTTTIAALNDTANYNTTSWDIKIKTISSDAELEQFLKDEFGKGCSLGAKKESAVQAGVFDIAITGDGKDLGETDCPLNYDTVVKYYPAQKKVAKWDRGQDYYFADGAGKTYDDEMEASFHFE